MRQRGTCGNKISETKRPPRRQRGGRLSVCPSLNQPMRTRSLLGPDAQDPKDCYTPDDQGQACPPWQGHGHSGSASTQRVAAKRLDPHLDPGQGLRTSMHDPPDSTEFHLAITSERPPYLPLSNTCFSSTRLPNPTQRRPLRRGPTTFHSRRTLRCPQAPPERGDSP